MSVGAEESCTHFLKKPLRLFIGDEFSETENGLATINPATGETLAEAPVATEREVDLAVQVARRALNDWRRVPPTRRARPLLRLADLVEEHKDELATLEVLDNGEPIGKAQAVDIALTIEIFRYHAGWTTKLAGQVLPNSIPGMVSMIRREPVGVVAAITPWNFPLPEVAYKPGPALAAACTVVVKPSELTPLTALRLAELIQKTEFPPGVVIVVIGSVPSAGVSLVRHPGVDKIAFTGQDSTGQTILRESNTDLKRVPLELGGKSLNIVFFDANLEAAASGVFGGIFFSQGQACVSGARLFVEEPIAEALIEQLVERAQSLRFGFELDEKTEMGPLVLANHRERVLRYVGTALEEGAEVVAGGGQADVEEFPGEYFAEPTVISGVANGMRVAQEEIFSPVLLVIPWREVEEFKQMANDVQYGLAAGIWTRDISKALRPAYYLDVEIVWIDTYGMFGVAVPFGGHKLSGYERELGEGALESYLPSKSVWIDIEAMVPQSGQGIRR